MVWRNMTVEIGPPRGTNAFLPLAYVKLVNDELVIEDGASRLYSDHAYPGSNWFNCLDSAPVGLECQKVQKPGVTEFHLAKTSLNSGKATVILLVASHRVIS